MSDVKFIEKRQPILKGGKYTLTARLENPAAGTSVDADKTITYNFTIQGESSSSRAGQQSVDMVSYAAPDETPAKMMLTLPQISIQAVFPPAGNRGEHTNVFPQVILNSSSLPWECRAEPQESDIPWLALLLFDENEIPEIKNKTLEELLIELDDAKKNNESLGNQAQKKPAFPLFEIASYQDKQDKVTVIDVRKETLERILPSGKDLKFLAHVRQGENGQEFAVLTCNRLPNPTGTNIVHLVSVQGRYGNNHEFHYQDASEANDLVRFLTLYNWRFTCEDPQQTFGNLLLGLTPGMVRLPPNDHPDVEKYLAIGCAPMKHTTRQGDQTVSWYHGPLLPVKSPPPKDDVLGGSIQVSDQLLPVKSPPQKDDVLGGSIQVSDQLLRFNPELGLFDVSYAAAWELGRFLALQEKAFAETVFRWKRAQVQNLQAKKCETIDAELPANVKTWMDRIHRLEGIPFNYLIPDERMLPPASIRFFYLDWLWLKYLQDGAFSIGRYAKRKDTLRLVLPQLTGQVAGFLIRSDVVAGWPGLLVNVNNGAHLLRMDRISQGILLCLYEGELKEITLSLRPETLHFELQNSGIPDSEVPWRGDCTWRVIEIDELAHKMKVDSSAQFASRMKVNIESVLLKLRSEGS